MEKLLVDGGRKLTGEIKVSGAKNVAMKVILAGLLTDEPLIIHNAPFISSVYGTADIVKPLGVDVSFREGHSITIHLRSLKNHIVPLELGGLYRSATMVMGPLLARCGKAVVPNPGGCRIGKRPIDMHIDGLTAMGAKIKYDEGYFYAEANKLHGTHFSFRKNTHTGTEALILAAVLAEGETVLDNAAEEPEIDDLILLLTKMGAKIKRKGKRTIVIEGVKELTGAEHEIIPDRNEVVTFAIAAISSGGDVIIEGTQRHALQSFLQKLDAAQGGWEPVSETKTRFFAKENGLRATEVVTKPHPGFMTDWQAPWAILATQAYGTSHIHETIYEDRFSYVEQLAKMGAKVNFYQPHVTHPELFYNFDWNDKKNDFQAISITGPTKLHDALLEVSDLRAGATLLVAALVASGESVILGVEHIDRGYEKIEDRLKTLGAKVKREKE